MNIEDLKELGLDDGQAQKVLELQKEELKSYIPRVRFNEVNELRKTYETQIKEDEGLKEEVE